MRRRAFSSAPRVVSTVVRCFSRSLRRARAGRLSCPSIALICEYLAVQQVATTIATNLIAALLPAVLQNQFPR